MQYVYAYRRAGFESFKSTGPAIPPPDIRPRYLAKVKQLGFDGIELGVDSIGASSGPKVKETLSQLEDASLPCIAIRGGGDMAQVRTRANSLKRLDSMLELGTELKARVMNVTLVSGPADPDGPGGGYGQTVSQGASRTSHESDFEVSAKYVQDFADKAAKSGMEVSIELHHRSIVDTSWTLLHLLKMINRPNVGANPDAGNTYWAYDQPEEAFEDAISALAPYAKYWHCKNLTRVYIPDLQRSFFRRVPLPDGDFDYRQAVWMMLNAGFDGYVGIEGNRSGDQLTADGSSLKYIRELIEEQKASA